jgi:hypothetical protein
MECQYLWIELRGSSGAGFIGDPVERLVRRFFKSLFGLKYRGLANGLDAIGT